MPIISAVYNAVPLIPRDNFFGNPDRVSPDISPDGHRLAFLAPLDGVLNIWTSPIDDISAAKPVTNDKHRGIRSFSWAYTSDHILYSQDDDGDENWSIFCIELKSNTTRNLTPTEKPVDEENEERPSVRAEIEAVSHRFPTEILVGLNNRDPRFHDVYHVNILTGQQTLKQVNPGYRSFVFDENYNIRFASKYKADGTLAYFKPAAEGDTAEQIEWEPFLTIPNDDTATTNFMGFDKAGTTLYMADSRGRDTAALMAMDLETGHSKLIAEDARTDVGAIKSHPTENTIQAVSFYYDRRQRKYLDAEVEADMKIISQDSHGDAGISSWSLDDRQWIVAHMADDGPIRYFHFNRDTKEMNFLRI